MSDATIQPNDFPFMVEVDRDDSVVKQWSAWANLNGGSPYYRFATEHEAAARQAHTKYVIYHWHDGRWHRHRSTTMECPT